MQIPQNARFLGFVQVQVGSTTVSLPVQTVAISSDTLDSNRPLGGFFTETDGKLGILVDENANEDVRREQIARASKEAVVHLSRRFLN